MGAQREREEREVGSGTEDVSTTAEGAALRREGLEVDSEVLAVADAVLRIAVRVMLARVIFAGAGICSSFAAARLVLVPDRKSVV